MLEQRIHQLKIAATELIQAMEWEESAHKRDKSGKFSGSGSGKADFRNYGKTVDGLDSGAKNLEKAWNGLGKKIGKVLPPSKTPVKDFVKGVKDLGKTTAKNIDNAAQLNAAKVGVVAAMFVDKKTRNDFKKELAECKDLDEVLGTVHGLGKVVDIGALQKVLEPQTRELQKATLTALDIWGAVEIGQTIYDVAKHYRKPHAPRQVAHHDAINVDAVRVEAAAVMYSSRSILSSYDLKLSELDLAAQSLIQAIGFEEDNHERDASGRFASKSGGTATKKTSPAAAGSYRQLAQDIDGSEQVVAGMNKLTASFAKAVGDLTHEPSKTPGADLLKDIKKTVGAKAKEMDRSARIAVGRTVIAAINLADEDKRDKLAKEMLGSKSNEEALEAVKGFVKSGGFLVDDPTSRVLLAKQIGRSLDENPLFQAAVGIIGWQIGSSLGAKAFNKVMITDAAKTVKTAQSAGKAVRKAKDAADKIYKDVAHTYNRVRTTDKPGSATVNTTATRIYDHLPAAKS